MTDIAAAASRPPLDPHVAKLGIGDVWNRSIQTFRATPWKFIALTLLPFPFMILSPMLKFAVGPQAAVFPTLVLAFLQYFLQFVGQSALIYGASRSLSGAGWTLGESLGVGINRIFPLFGIGILVAVPLLAIGVALAFMGRTGLIVGLVLAVPICMALAALLLAQQACIIEHKGPIQSIKRSALLSRNNRWRLIGLILLFVFLPLIALAAIYILGAFIVFAIHSATVTVVAVVLAFLTAIPAFLVYQAFITIALATAFVELRALKEGVAPRETVSRVFD